MGDWTSKGRARDTTGTLVLLGWSLTALSLLAVIPALALVLVPVRLGVPSAGVSLVQVAVQGVFLVVTPAMGLLIIRRQPHNVIGWLFIAFPGLLTLGYLGDGLARHLAPSDALAWIVTVTGVASNGGFLSFVLLLVLFPNGRVLSRRWRLAPMVGVFSVVCLSVYQALIPLPHADVPDVVNPIGQPGLVDVLNAVQVLGSLSILLALGLSLAHLGVRFRRANGIERQQLKWFGLATGVVVSLLVLAALAEVLRSSLGSAVGALADLAWAGAFSCFVLIPAAAAIAILRYRLYDIDRIISRTISYGLVTGLLVAAYAGLILLLQGPLDQITGGDTIAVAVSTLAVFALFQPMRRRVQRIVDRRFDRARYDGERTATTFAVRMRDEIDLDNLTLEVTGVVRRSLAPAWVGVWVRDR